MTIPLRLSPFNLHRQILSAHLCGFLTVKKQIKREELHRLKGEPNQAQKKVRRNSKMISYLNFSIYTVYIDLEV
jgi:hypothetical protein